VKKEKKAYDTKKSTRILVVVSSILLLGVVGMVIYNVIVVKERDSYMRDTENNYQQSFYELIESVNDIESKLGKLVVSNGITTQRTLVNDINKLTAVCVGHLSHLLQNDSGDSRITKFINQLRDYTGVLFKKLERGEPLTEEDQDKLQEIRSMIDRLGTELAAVGDKMAEGYNLINGYTGKDAFLKDIFDGLNEATVEYPQMIYDGPFSDSAEKQTAKGLTGEAVSESEARAAVTKLYEGKGLKNIDYIGDAGGVIPVYEYIAETADRSIYVSVTKTGGHILCINAYRSVGEQTLSDDECIAIAGQFAELLGFFDMKNVWISNYDGVMYINFAYERDDIIYYPDLVKIKVASDNGEILGAECANYYLNHTERDLAAISVSKQAAGEKLSKKLTIEYVRLALIPHDNTEKLCYEFYCDYDNAWYFVYIDVVTGEEVNILRVIDSGSGQLLY
jgi:germination protein YpeB